MTIKDGTDRLSRNIGTELSCTPRNIVRGRKSHLHRGGSLKSRTVESVYSFDPLKPSGHYMYHQFNIQQFYVLPTQCICGFCTDLRTDSDYFPLLTILTGFYNPDGVCLLRGTGWVFVCNSLPTSLTFNSSAFCLHSVFMCFVWV